MKKILLSITLSLSFLSILGCQQEDLDSFSEQFLAEQDKETELGVQYCQQFIKGGWLGLELIDCVENVSYPEQIVNISDARYDPSAYTPPTNNSDSMAGKWMMVNNTSGRIYRQICEVSSTQTADAYTVKCANETDDENAWREWQDFTYNEAAQKAFFYEEKDIPIRNNRNPGTVTKRLTASVSGMNLMQVSEQRDYVYENGSSESQIKSLYSFVRLADTIAATLGSISFKRKDFEGNIVLMEQYPIVSFEETLDGWVFKGENNELIAELPLLNQVRISEFDEYSSSPFQGNTYGASNWYTKEAFEWFPGVADALFDSLTLSTGEDRRLSYQEFELRLRQFDIVQNDAQGLAINFLVSRRYAERYQRDSTVGEIRLSY